MGNYYETHYRLPDQMPLATILTGQLNDRMAHLDKRLARLEQHLTHEMNPHKVKLADVGALSWHHDHPEPAPRKQTDAKFKQVEDDVVKLKQVSLGEHKHPELAPAKHDHPEKADRAHDHPNLAEKSHKHPENAPAKHDHPEYVRRDEVETPVQPKGGKP